MSKTSSAIKQRLETYKPHILQLLIKIILKRQFTSKIVLVEQKLE